MIRPDQSIWHTGIFRWADGFCVGRIYGREPHSPGPMRNPEVPKYFLKKLKNKSEFALERICGKEAEWKGLVLWKIPKTVISLMSKLLWWVESSRDDWNQREQRPSRGYRLQRVMWMSSLKDLCIRLGAFKSYEPSWFSPEPPAPYQQFSCLKGR